MSATATHSHVRWMIHRDMPAVLEIEGMVFQTPWTEDEFIQALRQRNCIGMVAERDERVIGYMIYELHKTRLHVLNLAVAPAFQRRGVGSTMVNKLKAKLTPPDFNRRSRIILECSEANLDGLLFFKSQGFLAVSVLRDFYADTNYDAIVMQYRYQDRMEAAT